jgi:hypothetical protein
MVAGEIRRHGDAEALAVAEQNSKNTVEIGLLDLQ